MKPQYMNQEDVTDESVYDHGFNDAINEVLKVIDWNISQTGNERESISKSARLSNLRWLREKFEKLRGGEQG